MRTRSLRAAVLLTCAVGLGSLAIGAETASPSASSKTASDANTDGFFFAETWIVTPATPADQMEIVRFARGSAKLDTDARKKLDTLLKRTGQRGAVREAYVAAYADELRSGNRDLPEPARKLARSRANALRQWLEGRGIDVTTFNMATRPGWWARLFNTRAAEVKGAAETEGWIARLLREHGQAGTATVVLATGEEKLSR